MKITDNEAMKALECCVQGCSGDCPLYLTPIGITCEKLLHKNILKLTSHQKAEIERYKGVIKLLENDVHTAKVEAVKEFAERLNIILKKKRKNEQSLFAKIRYGECILAVDNLVCLEELKYRVKNEVSEDGNDKQRERLREILKNHCAIAECKAYGQDCTAEDCASCLADHILADGWMRQPKRELDETLEG